MNGLVTNVSMTISMFIVFGKQEEYALRVMREREHAISDINKKMHQVNEIYKVSYIIVKTDDLKNEYNLPLNPSLLMNERVMASK